ncbi:hypothetical protein UlMin_010165 [Ulmus minor]
MACGMVLLTQPPPWPPRYAFRNPPSSFHRRRYCSAGYRRWNSNAGTVGSQRFGFDFKGKDEEEEEDDEYEEDYYRGRGKKRRWWSDQSPKIDDDPAGFFEEAIDSFWILKVFRSYGWTFPVIIVSWLLASGPKAFLMALALPLGQSALSLAYDKLWGRTKRRPKRKSRMRRKPFSRTVNDAEVEEEDEDEELGSRKRTMGYQSWAVGNEGPVNKGGQDAQSFGGWDDLERAKSAQRSSRMNGRSGRTGGEKGKLSRREKKSDTPLLLRLLIAFFPFLGSWTKMFW